MQLTLPNGFAIGKRPVDQEAELPSDDVVLEVGSSLYCRDYRCEQILASAKSSLKRVSESSELETAKSEDLSSVYKLFLAACDRGSEKSGFLRKTYSTNEFKNFIEEGSVRIVRGDKGEVAAFAVVLPLSHKKLFLEKLAVGISVEIPFTGIRLFFIQTCAWLKDKFVPPRWDDVRYIPLYAQSPTHYISDDLQKKLMRELAAEDPSKDIYMSVSALPKPNVYMTLQAQELGFERVGFFRSVYGRPMMLVSGFKWVRPWKSDIYRYNPDDLG